MKYTTFPSIHDIKISTGERSWTFSRSRFKLISPKLYSLTDINFFSGYSTQENNIVLELSKTAVTETPDLKGNNNLKTSSSQSLTPNDSSSSAISLSGNSSIESIQSESTNLNTLTILIPNDFSNSSVDAIIKYIYYQVFDITEETSIDLYCLSYSLGLIEIISKTSSYILYKFPPKGIVDTIRICWRRQVDSGPFDRAIEANFSDYISELHNLPAQKIFSMLKQNHLKVSPDGLANLISSIALRHCKNKNKKIKNDSLKNLLKDADDIVNSSNAANNAEEDEEDQKEDEEEENQEEEQKSDTESDESDADNDSKNEGENGNEGEISKEGENDCADFDNVHDILSLTDFLNFSECSPSALSEMFTSLGLLEANNNNNNTSSTANLNYNDGAVGFGAEFEGVKLASASGAIKICDFCAQLLKRQIEMRSDCKQMLSSLEKEASGVAGAAEYQLSIENERGLYMRKNLQVSDHYEQLAIEKGDPEIVLKIADKYYDKRKDRETAFGLYSRLLRPTEAKDAKRNLSKEEIKQSRSKCGEHIASRMREFLGPNNAPDAVQLLRLAISQGEENCCVFGYEFSLEHPNIISEGYAIGNLINVFGDFVVKIGTETIESDKFSNNSKLKSACIPPSVKRINDRSFNECTQLERVFIPPNVELIGTCAFSGCSSLVTVRLPRSLKEIGESSFSDCSSLKSINVSIGCSFETIEYGCFSGCINLRVLELPESLCEICDNAFCGCESLTSLRIPSTVRFIGEKAFMECKSLEKITFDDNSQLATIHNYAFSGCCSLIFLSLPPSVITIGDFAFEGCEMLQELAISFGVQSIGESCFYRCESLKKLDFPPSVRYIRDYAFYQCHSLKSLSLPLSVKEIGRYVFFQCVELQSLAVASFEHLNMIFQTANRKSLKYLKILSGPVSIQEGQIPNFEDLVEVEIPASVQNVRKNAFRNCKKIKNVVVETRHTQIDKNAFDCQPKIQYTN